MSREEITESELTKSSISGNNGAQKLSYEVVLEKCQPQEVKSTEEVIKEISQQVVSKNETKTAKKPRAAMPDNKFKQKPAGLETQYWSSQAVPIKRVIEAKAQQPAKTVETPAPKLRVSEFGAAEVKIVEVEKTDETDVQKQKAEAPGR